MRVQKKFPYYSNDKLSFIGLPYEGNNVIMYVLLPNQNSNVEKTLNELTAESINDLIQNLKETKVLVSFR